MKVKKQFMNSQKYKAEVLVTISYSCTRKSSTFASEQAILILSFLFLISIELFILRKL